ncbi:lysophospholipid acyltransferase family protein [Sphingomonas sp. GlSt437]|uniref:lysophospholipid acyltransferase family protein n=1 Tax=Sphingomonas sp. GlSt437 TaxID=3389970 RepID=UPI003A859EA2
MAWARTVLFQLIFYAGSAFFVLATPLTAALGQRALRANVRSWAYFHRWSARWLLGIRSRFVGHIPVEPVLYAAKHHAMFETLELVLALRDPAPVMKSELARIPIWGWAAQRYGVIVVDRHGSAPMLRRMMREAKSAIAEGRSVVIFPEGTRVRQGEAPPLKSGFAGLYRMLNLTVVPVALDSGKVWPKKGPKRAGDVTFDFGAPLPPGLPRAEIEARVHAAINRLG